MFDAAVVASFDPRFLHELRAADSRFRTLLFFAPHPVHTLCRMSGTIRPSATVCLFAPWIDTILEWSVASWVPFLVFHCSENDDCVDWIMIMNADANVLGRIGSRTSAYWRLASND